MEYSYGVRIFMYRLITPKPFWPRSGPSD